MISLRHQTARQPQISQPSCSSRLSYPLTHGICEFVGVCGCVCVREWQPNPSGWYMLFPPIFTGTPNGKVRQGKGRRDEGD